MRGRKSRKTRRAGGAWGPEASVVGSWGDIYERSKKRSQRQRGGKTGNVVDRQALRFAHYIMMHRGFRFPPPGPSLLVVDTIGPSCCLVARRARTRFMKSRSTLCEVFADVSRNSQPNERASAAPSSRETSRSYVLSHLLPTSTKIGRLRFTRNINCRNTSSRSNVARDAIEYTRINP